MSAPLLKRLADVRKQGDVGRLADDVEPVALGRKTADYDADRHFMRVEFGPLLDMELEIGIDRPTADVSSTAIRQRCRQHESLAGYVPDLVAQYIDRQQLYAPPAEAGSGGWDSSQTADRLHGKDH